MFYDLTLMSNPTTFNNKTNIYLVNMVNGVALLKFLKILKLNKVVAMLKIFKK